MVALRVAALGATVLAAFPVPAAAAPTTRSLTELQVALYGFRASVEPKQPIVPKQTASGLRIVVRAGDKTLTSAEVMRLVGGSFQVQAELSGPGLGSPVSLPLTGADAIPSADPLILTFPGLPQAGDYDISNIRLVRSGHALLDVEPHQVTLHVIEQVLVTSVVTRPLTLDEIRERGVVLDASAYLGFEFAITLKLESTPVSFRFPVVFDRQGVPVPIPLQPPPEPLRSVLSAPQLVPVLLRPAAFESDPDGAPPDYKLEALPEFQAAKIPSLLVIPGSVGYLKQFFSAQLMVGNGAPDGSGLSVADVTGTLRLPAGDDGVVGTTDDPLTLPALESGPQSAVVDVLGSHGVRELLPGEFGRAELTLRGEREGRHDVDFDIRAQLLGLPVGPVELEGSAHGAVLVRNAYFDVTFTVPTVVRADEEFSVFATVTNVGQGAGNDVAMTLDATRLSGARLLSDGTQTIATLVPGDAATLEYRFRSEVTGEVVASYLRFDTNGGVNVTGRLNFELGVGERRVMQSPDTLVLPAAVSALPSEVVRAAMRVLGQAWSAATATSLPPGVERPSTEAVFRKGLSVAEAGLRVELGQPMPEALRDLLLDLHGVGYDPGFDQVLRDTTAGHELDRVLGAAMGASAQQDALGYEEQSARIAASGRPFLSFALTNQAGGPLAAQAVLRDGSGRSTSLTERGVPGALLTALGTASDAPQLGWLTGPDAPPYTIELVGSTEGSIGLSLTLPSPDGVSRHARLDGIAVHSGSRHRLVYDPVALGPLVLEGDLDGDGEFEAQASVGFTTLDSEGPQLVAASTIGPETLDGASPFGTYGALLFDRVVSESDAALVSNYEIPQNSVLAAKRQLSGRLVFVAFEQPEGPLVETRLAVQGIGDERGVTSGRQEQPLGSRLLLPGAVVSGRVLEADGTPVADAAVTYLNSSSGRGGGRWDCLVGSESGVAAQRTDAAGRFSFRYVPQNSCGAPFRLETVDPSTGAVRGVKSYVRVDGQRLSLDLVLIGHGAVTGQVREAGGAPAAGARVRVVSVTDSQIGIVSTADEQGIYRVEGMTVGAVTVTAVLGENLGRGAGRLDAAGGTATVNVTLDGNVDITGVVRKLEGGVLTAVPGVDVVYFVSGQPLGLSVTDSLGQYRLLGVPAGPYRLDAGLNVRDKTSVNGNSVAGQTLVQNLVIEVLDYSNFGTVSGTVKRYDGTPMPDAWVSDNIVSTRADASGHYELAGVALSASPRSIQAVSPDGKRQGSVSVLLTVPGQLVTGADIQLSGLGAVAFQVLDALGGPVAGASVGLQGSCLHPCGCRFTNTDEQGIARFSELAFGTVGARAVAQGAAGALDSALGTAVVASETLTGGGVIRLAGFGDVTGEVDNPDGQPAHGATVELTGQKVVVGGGVCGLQTKVLGTASTDASGHFHFDAVHVGAVVARASSSTFPQAVTRSGSIDAAGTTAALTLQLVDTMAGILSGMVWLPDGSRGAGPDVEVTASGPVPDVTVHTDALGHYAFAAVLPSGGYLLTARDTRPGGTGSVVQARIWLQPAQAAEHDLRLKAKGPVRVRVVDGSGQPVDGALIHLSLAESDFPYRRYEGTLSGLSEQPLEFPAVFEGDFSVSASDNFARGGRASGAVPPQGLPVDVTLQLTTTGSVTGRFLWADGTTPLPLGTVRLWAGSRLIGQQTTASDGDLGSFAFDFVPAGPVTLSAEDPKSGRTGVANGALSAQGEQLKLDVVAYAVGRVEGDVSLNDAPAAAATVSLRSGPYAVHVNADGEGHYAVDGVPAGIVYASADLGGGFLAGQAQGQLQLEGETLELPIALHGAGTIDGTLLAADGQGPGAVSLVSLDTWGHHETTTTDDQGHFHFELVPEGAVTLVADALSNIDCARQSVTVTAGETVPATLQLRGVGAVEGDAVGSSGPVGGTATVNATGVGCQPRLWVLSVGPAGQFRIPEVVGGPVTASFATRAVGGPWLYANASDVVAPGSTTTLTLQVEPSGSVRGVVVHSDHSPAIGAQVRVDASGGRIATVQAGADGSFVADGVPAGGVTLRVTDPAQGGVALVTGLGVTSGAVLDAGEITLLELPLAVVAVSPPDGAVDLPVLQPVQVTFNAPLTSASGFSVRAAGRSLGFGATLSADALTVVLAPSAPWPDSAEITVEAGPWVTDIYGRPLAATQQSRFRTVDLSPPRVIAVTPADHAIQVDVATSVLVRFDEPIEATGDLSALVQLGSALGPVAGTVTASASDSLLFTPAAPLASNTAYTVTVNGARDVLGHAQISPFASSFVTPDADPPVLRLDSPPASGFTNLKRPTIRVAIEDALSGPDGTGATMRLDGFVVEPVRSTSQISFAPGYDLQDGSHSVEASARDRAGNLGTLAATFQVDTQPPAAAMLLVPAADQVLSGSVTLAGSASDTVSGVSRVNFLRDGVWIAEAPASSGYQAVWDTTSTPDGAAVLTAQPVDVAGNSGTPSPGVRVVVNNQQLSVAVGAPIAGFPVKDQVTVVANPSEPVARVEFRAGAGSVVVDDSAPYEAVLDVSGEPEGDLTLSVTAIGLAPETASATRDVLVDRTPPAAPASVSAESFADGSVLVAGPAASVEPGVRVEVDNASHAAHNERAAFEDGSFLLRVSGAAGDEIHVVAVDVAGNRSSPLVLQTQASEPAANAVPQDGLALWARAGRGAVFDAAGRVTRWADASAAANDLVQSTSSLRPSVDGDAASWRSLLRFDGADDFMQFTTPLVGSIRTVFAVVKQDTGAGSVGRALLGDATTADFYGGWPSWWIWLPPYVSTSASIVNGQTWVNGAVVNGLTTPRPEALSVVCIEATAGVTANRLGASAYSHPWKGAMAEILIYERPLSGAERKAVEDYLALEYVPFMATAGAPSVEPNGGTFDESVSVTLRSPTPGAEIRYTTDGSLPSESSLLYSGPLTLTSSATVRARAFRAAMKPSAVSAVSFDKASDFSPRTVPGLALWVRGDVGVETDAAGRISAWRDQSGQGNDLVQATPSLQPVAVPEVANGFPAARFDGGDDALSFTTPLTGTIRTVFAVVSEDADAGSVSRTLLGDATTADFYGGTPSWWYWLPPYVSTSQYVVDGQTWVNGGVIDGRTTPRPHALSVLCVEATAGVTASAIGKGLYGYGWKGDVAELVVYDRPLTPFERKSVEDSLALRYQAYEATAGTPEFTPNGGEFDDSLTVGLSSPTIGGSIHYTTDGTEPVESSPLYSTPLVLTATTVVKARTFRVGMVASPVALATFTNRADFSPADVAGLALWVRGDIGVEKDALSRVTAWRDQSGRGNDLVQPTPALQPVLVPGAAGALPAVHFDGNDDVMAFTTRLDASIRTLFAVVWEDADAGAVSRSLLGDTSTADFYGGWPNWWFYMPPYLSTSPSIVNGQTWVDGAVVNGLTTPRPTVLSVLCIEATAGVTASDLGKAIASNAWKGHVAELAIYDRALSSVERKAVEDYLALRYQAYVPTAGAPAFTPDGGSFETSLSVSIATGTPGATIRYTTDGSEPTDASPVYAGPLELSASTLVRARAYHPSANPGPVASAAFARVSAGSPGTLPGVQLWVSSDLGVMADATRHVEEWLDLSGHANRLRASEANAEPVLVPAAGGGLPTVRFDGVDDGLLFASRITTARTIFWVLREDPAATPGYRFLLGDANNYDLHSGANHELWHSSWSASAVRGGETRINGASVDGTVTPRPTSLSVVSLVASGPLVADAFNRDRTNPRSWWGDLAELLVFDRALGPYERKAVEDQLAVKHGLYVPTVSPPLLTPSGSTTLDPVAVSIESEPGAEIRYTTDESTPTQASALYTGPLSFSTRTVVRARAFKPGFQPSTITEGRFLDTATPPPMVPPGLALWVSSDVGVTTSGGTVSLWADQSGNGNDLVQPTAALQPAYVPAVQNGLPVLRFDGSNDSLAFTTRLDGTIRAVFAVLKQSGSQYWRTFLGDTTKDDFSPGSATLWSSSTNASVLNGETWLNGVLVNGTTTNRPQTMSVLSVLTTTGVTADRLFYNTHANYPWLGDIAELIVYTEPLTAFQRKSIEDYLTLKYAPFVGTVGKPELSPQGGVFQDSVEVALTTPTPGGEIHYTTDLSDPDESSPVYTAPLTFTATTTLQARAFRSGMNPSPVALANYARATDLSPAAVPGLVLWAQGDVGVTSDGLGRVQSWRDLSGKGNDLAQADPNLEPTFVPDAQAGEPVVRFDGANDWLGLASRLTTIRTVFWVIREDPAASAGYRFLLGDASAYDFHSGAAHQLWSTYTNAAIRGGETRINGALVDGLTANRPTSLSVVSLVTTGPVSADAFSRDRSNGRSWWGDLAELVVYDRALSATERKTVEDHLALKYGLYVPTLSAPIVSPNGSRTLAPVRVTLSALPGAEIRYTIDGSDPTAASTLYAEPLELGTPTTVKARAYRAGFSPSAVATARFLDITTPAPLLVPGLKLWVKADGGVVGSGDSVSTWRDQSGNGNDLVQPTPANQPQLVPAQANGLPVVRFDGAGDSLSFSTRLTNIRSVFWVIRRSASATPGYRYLLGDPTNYHFCSDPTTKIWSTSYTSASILNGETRLNGAVVNGTATDRPLALSLLSVVTTGDVTAGTFSKDRGSDSSWWGDLAELLIFDQPLSPADREAVEAYLAAKYALFTPSVGAPSIEPSGGTLSAPTLVQIGTSTPGATIHYTLDDSEPDETSTTYAGPFEITQDARVRARAFLDGWMPSGEAVASFYAPEKFAPTSVPDLALWVRSDAGVSTDGSLWLDQGGASNALVQPTTTQRPTLVFDAGSRMPLVRFDGAGDFMSFSNRLTKIRTVFWVVRRSAAMTPDYRLLLGDFSAYNFSSDATTKLWSASYTSPFILNGQTRLNGTVVSGLTTDRPANLSVISLVTTGGVAADAFSRDRSYGRSWWGDLAELVIYERALGPSEVSAVEAYLAGRYGIGLPP